MKENGFRWVGTNHKIYGKNDGYVYIDFFIDKDKTKCYVVFEHNLEELTFDDSNDFVFFEDVLIEEEE